MTPPSSWYVDPAFAALDVRAVFGTSWQPVCRASEIEARGSSVAGRLGDIPWLVTRADDGVVRAFFNVCRHKAAILADGAACEPTLTCPYHGWTYDLNGRLATAPRVAGIREFDRDGLSLAPMAVATWGFWVWVNPDPGATFFDLSALEARLAPTGWRDLTYVTAKRWTLECNWKVYVDNYLDGGYHIERLHPSLDDQLDMDSYVTELFDTYSIQSSNPSAGTERTEGGAVYAWLWPCWMLNRYGPCLDTNHVVPLGPDRCEVVYEFYFADPTDTQFIENSIAQADLTQREDVGISESVQAGMRSGGWTAGRYAPRVEIGEHHFHRLLAAAYGRALASKT